MKLPRAICPVCGRDVAVRKGGELREHGAWVLDNHDDVGLRWKLCPASGNPAVPVQV